MTEQGNGSRTGLMGTLYGSTILALAIGFPGVASAQEDPSSEAARTASNREVVVVTATKREESIQDLPMAINAVASEQLENSRVENLADVQFLAAGIHIGERDGGAIVTIRGIGPNGGGESGSAVHLDGVFLEDRRDAARAFFDVERLEVLRGPQGTLYGRNATGGAVNIITKSPTYSAEHGLKLTLGNYALVETEGYMSGPLFGETLTGRIAFKTEEHDGYTPNIFNGNRYDNADNTAVRGKLRFEPTDRLRVDVAADYSRDEGANANVLARSNESVPLLGERAGGSIASGRAVSHDFDAFADVENVGLSARVEFDFENVLLTSISGFRNTDYKYGFDFDGTDATAGYPTFQFADSNQASQELNLTSIGDGRLKWVLGASYFSADDRSGYLLNIPFFPLAGHAGLYGELEDTTNTEGYAVFGEASYELLDKLTVTLGARYSNEEKTARQVSFIDFCDQTCTVDDPTRLSRSISDSGETTKSWDDVTPKISIGYEITDDSMMYATVGRGFKSGGFNGAGIPFNPENVTNYEVGTKSAFFDGRVRANAAVFLMDYTDLQVTTVTVGPDDIPIFDISNAADSTIKGVELDFLAKVTDKFAVDGTIAYLDAKYGDFLSPDPTQGNLLVQAKGNRLIYTPEWAFNIGGQYETELGEWGSLTLRGEYSYQTRIFFDPRNDPIESQPAASLLNGSVTFAKSDDRWRISAFVKNITDEEVFQDRYAVGGVSGFALRSRYRAPRTYGLTLAMDY